MLRILIVISALACAWAGSAAACRTPGSNSTIFFDEVPVGINADVVARITVTQIVDRSTLDANSIFRYRWSYVAIAHVEEVLKGMLEVGSIIIVAPASSCDIELSSGAYGIVAGKIQVNATGERELFAISESRYQRQIRKSSSK